MTATEPARYVLTVSCPEANGIVREVSDFLFQRGATISDAAQHRDPVADQFFMRVEFEEREATLPGISDLNADFSVVAEKFHMSWHFYDLVEPCRVLLAVSRHGHCLNDLLHRWESGVLPAKVVGVVSNHETLRSLVEWYGLTFHYLPVPPGGKSEQEALIDTVMQESGAELLGLARYMQILSGQLCEKYEGQIINIHHSFLPGFKGADPYRQAYERGVKIIGATAHYVTADLDEGPIIEQTVEKVDHNCDIEELRQIGRDAECSAFARAIKWHCERRVIINGNRTIVFR